MQSDQYDDQEYEYTEDQMLELDAIYDSEDAYCPGVKTMIFALYLAFIISSNKVLWHLGIHVSQRLVSTVGAIAWFLLFAAGARRYLNYRGVWQMANPGHRFRVVLWLITIVILTILGVALKNRLPVVGKEAIILFVMGISLILGCDDLAWQKLEKPLVVMFYVALVIVIWGRNIAAVTTTYTGTEGGGAAYSVGSRAISTLASNLKPLMGAGLFLGAIGMVRPKTDIWRFLELFAIPASFVVFVGIFKFRGALVSIGLLIMTYLLVRPVLEGKMRVKLSAFLMVCILIGGAYFVTTKAFEILSSRFTQYTEYSEEEGALSSRLHELELFRKDIGMWWVPGRGIGGTFSTGGAAYGDSGYEWGTLHFGVLGFLLKGGVWMFMLFLSFIITCLKIKPRQWYQNPYNMAATLMLPVLMVRFFLNPIGLGPESVFTYLTSMFCLARFARREELDCDDLYLYGED